ncbi:hypothetical protein J2T07_002590 [Luteibacter jiangsuensis]|uniref:DUF3606 domain-containing protein n=2 Tax=Luteibacter jiangsuensis TaxID=637577 RepID=A0ABT9SZG0_9GAMM|nr:hypothetical protein [Luteibacter jiangsuensis]
MEMMKRSTRPADATKIDLESRTEVNWWVRSLGVSEQSLRDAVKRVGQVPGDVRAELRRRR